MKRQLAAFIGVLTLGACATSHVEEPAFDLHAKSGQYEIRKYGATIIAETTVEGNAWDTRFEGFGPLADYIFAKGREGEAIAMTAPVTQVERKTIAMTAPVSQKPAGSSWTIAFTMPSTYTLSELPKPVNPNVRLVEVAPRTMAVATFSGFATDSDMTKVERKLRSFVDSAGLSAKGDVEFAFYNPPWVLPWLRRNEAMIEVEDSPGQTNP